MEPEQLGKLMAAYCDGDAAAFRALYDAVAGRLLKYARALVREQPAAEDVLQRSFLKLHGARSAYVRGADPLPWLYTIVHRTALDELRRLKRAPVADAARAEGRAALTGIPEELAPAQADRQFLASLTMAALEELPARQREVVVLLKLHGASIAEVAAITGSTPNAVKVRAHRAYEKLRELVKRQARREGA